MADIYYHGIKEKNGQEPREPSRALTLKLDILAEENRRMRSLVISRDELVPELERMEKTLAAIVAGSNLEKRAKAELLRIILGLKAGALRAGRVDMKTILKRARSMDWPAGDSNGSNGGHPA
jgi:hypothetical protein